MLLLHISDIHFRAPDCQNPAMDPEQPLRTSMIRDARVRSREIGNVDAIVVGGDIAFQGSPAEYEAAMVWLKELASATGCSIERIFVVPGNHDVDRRMAGNTVSVRNVHAAIAGATDGGRARELRMQFQDPAAGHALLSPLAAYNDFAKVFNCQIYSPDKLFWIQDLAIDDKVKLRIHGLTSTLLSGMKGENDVRGGLYLSPLQTVLDPVDDVINMVVCHHPPDWFLDNDEIDDQIRGRAALHLFGHKHRQRIYKDASYVRFGAAAVNPDRTEGNWQPGYNLINIAVTGEGYARALEIGARLLQWQTNPDQFVPKMDGASYVFSHTVPFPDVLATPASSAPTIASADEKPSAVPVQVIIPPAIQINSDLEASMGSESTRNLVFRFWKLRASERRELALRMGLVDAAECISPEPERYGRALLRARERDLLEQLGEEIAKLERK